MLCSEFSLIARDLIQELVNSFEWYGTGKPENDSGKIAHEHTHLHDIQQGYCYFPLPQDERSRESLLDVEMPKVSGMCARDPLCQSNEK